MGQDVKVKLGDQEYRPQEISAMILRVLRDRAARQLAQPVNGVVFGAVFHGAGRVDDFQPFFDLDRIKEIAQVQFKGALGAAQQDMVPLGGLDQ